MLMPAQPLVGGLLFSAAPGGGVAPTTYNQGITIAGDGRLIFDTAAVSGSTALNGFRTNGNGNIFAVTSTNATDVFVNGYRFSVTGALVLALEQAAQVFFNGQGFRSDGSLCATVL